MITDYYINKESDWQNLPWQYINGRILLIQKKIFEASRQHNLNLLHKIQNYLLNSNEARLFAINKILDNIQKYYKLYNCEDYFSENTDKFYLFKYFFNYDSILKTKLKLILEHIKEYLIYLCLEPEWKARLSPKTIEFNEIDNYTFIANKRNLNNINWNKIIYHSKCIPYISHQISYWTNNNFFIEDKYSIFTYLANLLMNINNIEVEWNYIKLIKWNQSYAYIKKTHFKYKKNLLSFSHISILKNYLFSFYSYLSNIIIEIKSKFYNKDYLNRWKLNAQLIWKNIMSITSLILQIRLPILVRLLNHSCIIYIINVINFLLSSLKFCKNYNYVINLLDYYKFNLFNILNKKVTLNFLYQYLFKINR